MFSLFKWFNLSKSTLLIVLACYSIATTGLLFSFQSDRSKLKQDLTTTQANLITAEHNLQQLQQDKEKQLNQEVVNLRGELVRLQQLQELTTQRNQQLTASLEALQRLSTQINHNYNKRFNNLNNAIQNSTSLCVSQPIERAILEQLRNNNDGSD